MVISRTFDFVYSQLENLPIDDCLSHKVNGSWKKYSTKDFIDISHKIALGLLHLGLKKGDKVAIVSPNRPEWNFIDQGSQIIGVVTVPMYPTITVEDYRYIFEHAEVKAVFTANSELVEKVKKATVQLPIEHIYSFDEIEGVKNWKQVLSLDTESDESILIAHRESILPDEMATIIYTSGTTGRPKGVMLSHRNVASNVIALSTTIATIFVKGKDVVLSFLPLCHIYERVAVYFYLQNSLGVYYAESMDSIGENIKEIKPHMFTCVPRLLEKVYDKIISKGYELSFVKRKLFFWAVEVGLIYEPTEHQGVIYNLKLKLARRLIFSKWKEALGGNIKFIASGAAALQPRLARIFWAAEMPVYEGYGLTETSPAITANCPGKGQSKIGTVGKAIQDVTIKIAEDGEILCKGPNVMLGYYKNPEMTEEVITDGWFHTGDIGVVENGFLRITDRKKEMFKTSGGKYIAPQMMENKFKESPYIEQIMVIGEGQKFPSALIVPNYPSLIKWSKKNGLKDLSKDQLLKESGVLALFSKEIGRYNEEFGNWEQIKKFELVDTVWGVDSGELTPTLKLKRRVIKEKFNSLIERIYMMST